MLSRCLNWISSDSVTNLLDSLRRQTWFLDQISIRKLGNLFGSASCYVRKVDRIDAWPVAIKIDISPLCNLRCTICVHAEPNGNPLLEKQEFHAPHKMSVERFRRIIEEIKGKVSAVSLYYLGDPLVHPDLDEMCRIARDASLNVHLSTNFSFNWSDERVQHFVESGVTHLTVCVDGLSQAKYEKTRVGGRIEWVLRNLKRTVRHRALRRQIFPRIEVQYVKFRHNEDEVDDARKLCRDLGVEQFATFQGMLGNYTDDDPAFQEIVEPKASGRFPTCVWPYASMVIKYNGDVIPCCTYRFARQYTPDDDPRIFGNVFATSVFDVWNSPAYRQARRISRDPQAADKDPATHSHFCHGCPTVYQTRKVGAAANYDTRYKAQYDELYSLNHKGRPVRRRETVSWTPSAVEVTEARSE